MCGIFLSWFIPPSFPSPLPDFPLFFCNVLPLCFLLRLYNKYKKKGAAMICCVYELTNEKFVAEGREVDCDNAEAEHHPLMPRTRALPLYTMEEFNLKVLVARDLYRKCGGMIDSNTTQSWIYALGSELSTLQQCRRPRSRGLSRRDTSQAQTHPFTHAYV